MKKAMLAVIMIFAFVLATAASAALVVSSPTLGSKTTERGTTVSSTFTVQNTAANASVTSLTQSNNVNAKYNLSITGLPSFLNASQTQTVTISALVSKDHAAVNAALKEVALSIGTFTISGTESGAAISSPATAILLQAENQLELKKVRVTVSGGKSDTVDDGDKVDDLKPGDKLNIEIEVENKFSNDDDVDFDSASVEVKSDDDDDVDVDDDEDIDISSDDTEIVKFSDLEVEDDASDGTVKVVARVSGNDDNGAFHGQEIEFKLEINRESHEIRVDSTTLRPTTVLCEGDRTVRADVRVTNIGRNDEDDVVIEADAPGFSFNERKNLGSLDEDDSGAASFVIPVAKTVKPGAYQLSVNTYWETSIRSDAKSFTVVVAECGAKELEKPVITPVVTPVQQTPPQQPIVVVPPTVSPVAPKAAVKASSFTDSPAYVALLALAAVIVLLALIFLVVKLTRRS